MTSCAFLHSSCLLDAAVWLHIMRTYLFAGGRQGVLSTEELSTSELLAVSHAVAYLEGEMGVAPDVEDLHVFILEKELTPALRSVLSLLPSQPSSTDQTPSSACVADDATMEALNIKYWQSQPDIASSAPSISPKQLMRILQVSSYSEEFHDPAASQVLGEQT